MSGEMTADEFQSLTGVSRETMDKFICYSEMLSKWQKSINLVSNSTISDMWRRHFYDSAQLLSLIEKKSEPLKILDIGSGAGFPGLVLSILGAGEVHLVESVGKKCAFMNQVIQKTNLI
ncbi:MAG TPA: 16S rRNA (guanine(527)-N(7))-methyltransferase RsmG [Emcibacteraceae bacterium]|nr:16S rRNA (guanine(527)-N(7))-methyltransferase RsmG [Emcibacteraceae bacterium]